MRYIHNILVQKPERQDRAYPLEDLCENVRIILKRINLKKQKVRVTVLKPL
jgi:hypothetical protein